MKRLISLLFVLVLLTGLTNAGPYKSRVNVSFNVFYESLSPHGEWIELEADVVVWRPTHVHNDWNPYTRGSWHWTSDGWYWHSSEPFGWAVYHYGRWHYDNYYGWVWLPGYRWAPAWVEWRYSDNYIGWAPLSPYAYYKDGIGIRFSARRRLVHYDHWHFVQINNFCGTSVHRHIVTHRRNKVIFRDTRARMNYYGRNDRIINGGVDRRFVEKYSGRRITERQVYVSNNERKYRKELNSTKKIISYRPDKMQESQRKTRKDYSFKRSERKSTLRKDKLRINNSENSKKNRGSISKYKNYRNEEKTIKKRRVKNKIDKNIDRRIDKKTREKIIQKNIKEKKRIIKKQRDSRSIKKESKSKDDKKKSLTKTKRSRR